MTGAERAEIEPGTGFERQAEPDWLGAPIEEPAAEIWAEEPRPPRSLGVKLLGALLLLLALGWIGASGWSIYQTRPVLNVANAVSWAGAISGPLILFSLLWLIFGRTSRRETERLTRAVAAMRSESVALEAVLEIVSTRLEENHARLRGEAEKLMSLGDEAADRLGRVTYYLSKESSSLERHSGALEGAAAAAKTDIGVLLHDLPRAEEVARAVAEAMKEAGLTAHGRAGTLEVQLAALTARGREADDVLGGAAERMAAHVARIESGSAAAAASIGEASATMNAGVDGAMTRSADAVDAARLGLEAQGAATMAMIEQSRATLEQIGEDASRSLGERFDEIEDKIEKLAGHLTESEANLTRQRESMDALLTRIEQGVGTAEAQLQAIGAAAGEAEGMAARIVADTGPELIESLLRVREAANQAAERAREAIAAVIPASAASLGEAGRVALSEAVDETVGGQVRMLESLAQRALDTARGASERLTSQMLALGETSAAIEARIDEGRREREQAENENFSRRVALLIESLNSTAIDVTKILSNEVTDTAWAAYLKGDRGVFTRRAVRLLDATEAREIARHYEEEAEFREQVNRYIHDFESMLRRVLADRDGAPLGVTILSSDMGKLYVALAQAIERLRT